jgi:glycosyltransferase involved in cell wall biosynthesis
MLTNYLSKSSDVDFSLITGRSKLLLVAKKIKKFEDAGFISVYRLGPTPADIINGFVFEFLQSTPPMIKKMHFVGLCHEAAKSKVAKQADIFHIHGIWGLTDLEYVNIGVFLSQYFHKPLVVTLHGGVVGDPLTGAMPLQRPEIKRVLDYASIITTYSKDVRGTLEQMGLGDKTRLLTNFVDTAKFKNTSTPKNGNTVTYVGRLEPPQTPEILVESFREVTARIPNAKMQIVGYGSMVPHLQKLIHQYSLGKNVFLLGKQTDVRRFLWGSDIFVATNFGYIASLEAWSAGLAVVAPNFGVLKETITHRENGLLFIPNDFHSLAQALIELLENKSLQAELASKGQQNVQAHYDIRAVAPKMYEIYQSVMKN